MQHQGSLPQADTDLVLSHTYWTARFGADPEVLGSTLRLDDQIYTIVGILGETFAFPPLPAMYRPDAWASLQSGLAPEARTDRGVRNLWAVGRLTRGVDLDQAQVEMDAIARALEQAHPETNRAAGVSMGPLNTYWNDALQSDMPLILLGAALALLVTCSNVAGLLLSRAMRRTREMAVRAALGAEPLRLARQLATEVGLLVIAGVGVGLACAHAALPVLLRQLPQSVFFSVAPAVDLRVFAIIAVVACATGLLTALALIAGARPGHDASVLSISVGNAPRRPTLRRGLVVVQVGLSMVTVLVGVLLAQSLGTALREPVGFDTANLLALRIALPTELGDDAERRTGLLERIRERAGAIVEDGAAALAASGPFGGGSDQRFYSIAGRPVPEGDQPPGAGYRRVSRNYFDVLGLPMLRGQPLPARTDGVLPVVVNQAFVDLHFPNEDPVGAGVTIFSELQEQLDVSQATAAEIVGVAASEKIWRLDMQPLPQIYAVVGASPPVAVDLLVRTDQPTATLERLRSGLAPLLPGVPLDRVRQIGDDADDTVWGRRLGVVVMNLFAGLALVLAAIGVYGVLSSAVHQRRRELGIRTALGAMPSRLIRLVLRDGLTLATAGVVLGLLGSLVASRFLASFLYGVSATDPLTVVAVTALLLVLATCAAVVPARRAGRTDPATVLREE